MTKTIFQEDLKDGNLKKDNLRNRIKTKVEPLAEFDKEITRKLSVCASTSSTFGNLRPHMKLLELSCHGIPWLATCLVILWYTSSIYMQQMILNILTAIVVDLIWVGIIKAFVRRRRPSCNQNDMFATIGVDNYAFPSGHASRAIMLACIFYTKNPLGILISLVMIIWAFTVCASRVLMGRHHVGDVLAGIALGYFEYCFICWLWFDEDSTKSILQIFLEFENFHAADIA